MGMHSLNPTLWRTCKMLTGKTRIRLLRELYRDPGKHVSALGTCVGIRHAAASQELRRIQSRGFLQSARRGTYVYYRMVADPQVSSAAPLLKAIQASLSSFPPEQDERMRIIAAGLSHERRIRMVRGLLHSPRTITPFRIAVRIPDHSFRVHLQTLMASGFVGRSGNRIWFEIPDHPLARALAQLIRDGAIR